MILLDPVLGGKIRSVLITLFAALAVVVAYVPDWKSADWYQLVVTVYGIALGVIEVLTHATPIGNQPADLGNVDIAP